MGVCAHVYMYLSSDGDSVVLCMHTCTWSTSVDTTYTLKHDFGTNTSVVITDRLQGYKSQLNYRAMQLSVQVHFNTHYIQGFQLHYSKSLVYLYLHTHVCISIAQELETQHSDCVPYTVSNSCPVEL